MAWAQHFAAQWYWHWYLPWHWVRWPTLTSLTTATGVAQCQLVNTVLPQRGANVKGHSFKVEYSVVSLPSCASGIMSLRVAWCRRRRPGGHQRTGLPVSHHGALTTGIGTANGIGGLLANGDCRTLESGATLAVHSKCHKLMFLQHSSSTCGSWCHGASGLCVCVHVHKQQ